MPYEMDSLCSDIPTHDFLNKGITKEIVNNFQWVGPNIFINLK